MYGFMNIFNVYILQRADTGSKKSRHVSKNKAQNPQEGFIRTVEAQG
jgi:hypothetical protein